MCREYYFGTGYAAIISNSQCSLLLRNAKSKGKGIVEAGKAGGTPNIDQNREAFGLSRLCSAMFELLLALEGIFSNFEQEFCLPKQFLTKI